MKNELLSPSIFSPLRIASQNILTAVKYCAEKYSKGDLIDIGCGMKPYESLFYGHVNSYFGIDYEPTSESNYGEKTRADKYVDCTDTGIEPESFDTILCTQVIEHVYDTRKFIAESHRLLKKGGHAFFTVPMSWRCHAEPYDYYRFTKYSLKEVFRNAGFEIIEIRELEGAFASLIQHYIVFLVNRPLPRTWGLRHIRYALRILLLPLIFFLLNIVAITFDRLCWDDKFCLNYLVVLKK